VPQGKPNILFIMNDQHRFDRLSCVSQDAGGPPHPATPNLDRIAAEGVRFTNAYAPSPVCAPSRAAIKSGMYPPGCGVVNNWVPFKEDFPLLTHRLQDAGYYTGRVGKLHFVPHLRRFGFDWGALNDAPYSVYAHDDKFSDYIHWLRQHWDGERDPVELFDEDENAFKEDDWERFILGSNFRTEAQHDIPWAVAEAERFLDERDADKPFFLFLSFFGPHQPFAVPEPWNSLYAPEDVVLPPQFGAEMTDHPVFARHGAARSRDFRSRWDEADYRRIIAPYYGQIAMIDHYVGRFFQRLDADGLWEDTLVIFCADHGDHNGAYGLFFKGEMYDSCCKVPLFIKPAGGDERGDERGGERRAQNVNLLDLYGTILDAAGDADWRAPHIEARSLAPLLADADASWENETYSIIGADPLRNLTMLRRDDIKLVRLAEGPLAAHYELYDMNDEVPEVRNVFEDPAYAAVRDALKADLDAWWAKQAARYPDPLIDYHRRDG
jgi:arylsulfatase A-like enzyme